MMDHRLFNIRHADHEYHLRKEQRFSFYPLKQSTPTESRFCRVLAAVGRWMVSGGMALQSRYGKSTQQWNQQQMTERQWERAS
jgi:hypothetical protein